MVQMPALSVISKVEHRQIGLFAIIDTGSTFSLFDGEIGLALGITLQEGRLESLKTLDGHVRAYAHKIDLEIDLGSGDETWRMEGLEILFSVEKIPRNILGRIDFLSRVQFGIAERTETIYLEPES